MKYRELIDRSKMFNLPIRYLTEDNTALILDEAELYVAEKFYAKEYIARWRRTGKYKDIWLDAVRDSEISKIRIQDLLSYAVKNYLWSIVFPENMRIKNATKERRTAFEQGLITLLHRITCGVVTFSNGYGTQGISLDLLTGAWHKVVGIPLIALSKTDLLFLHMHDIDYEKNKDGARKLLGVNKNFYDLTGVCIMPIRYATVISKVYREKEDWVKNVIIKENNLALEGRNELGAFETGYEPVSFMFFVGNNYFRVYKNIDKNLGVLLVFNAENTATVIFFDHIYVFEDTVYCIGSGQDLSHCKLYVIKDNMIELYTTQTGAEFMSCGMSSTPYSLPSIAYQRYLVKGDVLDRESLNFTPLEIPRKTHFLSKEKGYEDSEIEPFRLYDRRFMLSKDNWRIHISAKNFSTKQIVEREHFDWRIFEHVLLACENDCFASLIEVKKSINKFPFIG